jgi:hypothetical protein
MNGGRGERGGKGAGCEAAGVCRIWAEVVGEKWLVVVGNEEETVCGETRAEGGFRVEWRAKGSKIDTPCGMSYLRRWGRASGVEWTFFGGIPSQGVLLYCTVLLVVTVGLEDCRTILVEL